MTVYNASKDGYSKDIDDFASTEVLTLGDTGGESFIRFTGVTKRSEGIVYDAKLRFKAHASDSDAASIKISGLLGCPSPNAVDVWRDDFDAASLDLAKWKYEYSMGRTQLTNSRVYPQGNTIIYSRVKLAGDFDVRARLTSIQLPDPWSWSYNRALLMILAGNSSKVIPPIIGTYDYRIKRVGSKLLMYHKVTTEIIWTLDSVEEWNSLDCNAVIYFDLYLGNQYDSLGYMYLNQSGISAGQSLYSNTFSITRAPCMLQYQFFVYWDIDGGLGGGGVYSFLLDTRIGTGRLKVIHTGTTINAYYGVDGSWILLYSVDNVGPNALVGIAGILYANPSVERAECNADFIVIGYSGDLIYLTDTEISSLLPD